MIRLVEIYKKNSVAKAGYGYEQSVEEDKYHLREIYCNESAISMMKEWVPSEGSLMPSGLDPRQGFTSIEVASGAAYKTLYIVKSVERLNEEIQGCAT